MMLAERWRQLSLRGRVGLMTLVASLAGLLLTVPHARENLLLVRALKEGVPTPLPDDAPAALHLLAANTAFNAGEWDSAAHHWELARHDARAAFPAQKGLCRVALRRLDRPAAERYCVGNAMRPFLLVMEAKRLWRDQQREAAILAAEVATHRDPQNGEAWSVLAGYLLAEERYAEAFVANERALALSPDAPWLYERQARILMGLERWDEAAAFLDDAVRQFPDTARLYFLAAEVARKQGDTAAAEQWYTRIVERWPDDWRAWNMLGVLARERGDWETALEHFRRAVEKGSDSPWVWYSYAQAAMQAERPAEAEQALDDLWAFDPPPNLQLSMARLYWQLGAAAKAEQTLDRIAPLDIPVDWQLGVARLYRDMGLVEKARRAYERVLDADPQHEAARKELDALQQSP
ncbi:MAG: tetratricopeptide repeat protein [Ardenticatenia bacterium]|nr:MAG: tetratricopeptide repeat protein [Ardenticatenia bacterium]